MADPQFRNLLVQDPQQALNQVDIQIDDQTATAIKDHLAGMHKITPSTKIYIAHIG
jgi:hypothetical protein